MWLIRVILCYSLIYCYSIIYAQNAFVKKIGLPFIKNYPKEQYGASSQNWCITYNNNGILYIGNNSGLLEYDGNKWRLFQVPNSSSVRAVAIDKRGRIFVGAYEEFGYFENDSTFFYRYKSLSESLPSEYQKFGEVWKIHFISDDVYIQSFLSLFKLSGDSVKVLTHNQDYQFSFYVNNRLFVQSKSRGLLYLQNDSLLQLPGSEIFVNNIEVWSMLTFGNNQILIGTQNYGLFIYDGTKFNELNNEASEFLKKNQMFASLKISKNEYAFGSIQDGLIFVNQNGEILKHINRNKGLRNNTILSISTDKSGQLWLGLDNGLAYIEINSPFRYINEGRGVEGTGYVAHLFKNHLYLGTNQGLFYHNLDNKKLNDDFVIIPNTKGQVWSLFHVNEGVICGHNFGTFIINGISATKITSLAGGWIYRYFPGRDDLILGGNFSCLAIYCKINNNWQFSNKIKGFDESCRFVEFDDNDIWVSHGYKGVYQLQLNDKLDSAINIRFYNINDGLPSNIGNTVWKIKNDLLFTTKKNIYNFNKYTSKFEPFNELDTIFCGLKQIFCPIEDIKGNIWFTHRSRLAKLSKTRSSYTLEDSLFIKLSGSLPAGFENISYINDSLILVGSENGFIAVDPSFTLGNYNSFSTIIREIIFLGKSDTIRITNNSVNSEFGINSGQIKILPFDYSSVSFDFSAIYFENNSQTLFQYKLENFDENWSLWSNETKKEYTNLSHGKYVFKVKAKNLNGINSQETQFLFEILPPWYRTTYAYIFYVVFIVLLIYQSTKIIFDYLEIEKRKVVRKQEEKIKQQEREFREAQMVAEQEIIQLKNEKLQAEIEKKRAEVELKSKKLSSMAMQITHKNEVLTQVKDQLESVSKNVNPQAQNYLKELTKRIDGDLKLDEDWERFKMHFDEVHGNFLKRLKDNHPDLTPSDLKFCAYLRMNLNTKEIAPLLNITIRGVEIRRYRLRKKLSIDTETNLVDYILQI